jgi:hypothetical protein
MREYSLGVNKTDMKEMYDDSTRDKQGFLMLDLEGDKEKRFRSGFNEYYVVEEEL